MNDKPDHLDTIMELERQVAELLSWGRAARDELRRIREVVGDLDHAIIGSVLDDAPELGESP